MRLRQDDGVPLEPKSGPYDGFAMVKGETDEEKTSSCDYGGRHGKPVWGLKAD